MYIRMVVSMGDEDFFCGLCNVDFTTENWFNTQKTSKLKVFPFGKVTKRKQTGCPKCHHSVSKAVR